MGRKNKEYTPDEVKFIRENMYRFKPQTLAEKLNRPLASICEIVNYYRAHDKGELWDYTFPETLKILNIHQDTLRSLIKKKKLLPLYNFGIKTKRYVFSRFDLRDYVINDKRAKLKEYQCIECGQNVIGDLYCRKHVPSYLTAKKRVPDRVSFQLNHDPQVGRKLGEIFAKMRQERGKTRTDVFTHLEATRAKEVTIRRFEEGKLKNITLDHISELYNAMDCTVKLTIERNPKTW